MGIKGVFGAIFLLAGAVILLVTSTMLVEANLIALRGTPVMAEVTGFERAGRKGGWKAVHSFTGPSGRTYLGRVRHGFFGAGSLVRREPPPGLGRKIRVIYDPANPTISVADSFMGRWSFIVMLVIGLPHLILGGFLLRSDRREQREYGFARRRF